MTELQKHEEALFEVWFHLQRRKSFEALRDYGTLEDHPHWGMGAYNDMKKSWHARASLHVSRAIATSEQQ